MYDLTNRLVLEALRRDRRRIPEALDGCAYTVLGTTAVDQVPTQ